jgi:hypothetical protein
MSESLDYLARQLLHHQARSGDCARLFQLIDDTPFLRFQAGHLDGFAAASRGLEEEALDATLQCGDWQRFLRYAALSANLRALCKPLAHERALGELVRHRRLGFALDTLAHTEIHWRLLMRAILADSIPRAGQAFVGLVRETRQDLEALTAPPDEETAERRLWTLVSVARGLGPELERELAPLAAQSGAADLIWAAAAEGCATRSGAATADFWRFLAKIESVETLRALPEVLADCERTSPPEELLANVEALPAADDRLFWQCCAALVAHRARTDPAQAMACWRQAAREKRIVWSVELVEQGREFFRGLAARELGEIAAAMHGEAPSLAAAMRVLAARAGDEAAEQEARLSLAQLAAPERLHWLLRLLSDRPVLSAAEVRDIFDEMARNDFAVPVEDARRLADLFARSLSENLESFVEEMVWSAGLGLEFLEELVEHAETQVLLELLFTRMEAYLAAFGMSEVAAFAVWQELSTTLAGRLCVMRQDLQYLDRAVVDLGDEDQVRSSVAQALAKAKQRGLALLACRGIRERRLLTGSLLQAVPEVAYGECLRDPVALFEAIASVELLEAEILGLLALLDLARPLPDLYRDYLARVRDANIRTALLVRLVRFGLEHPQRCRWSKAERTFAARCAAREMGGLPSDAQLILLTPELVDITILLGTGSAVAELREGFRRLLDQEPSASELEPLWCDAFQALLTRLHHLLAATALGRGAGQVRRAAALIAWLVERLTAPRQDGDEERPANRVELLGCLTCALERLPDSVIEHLASALTRRLGRPARRRLRHLRRSRTEARERLGAALAAAASPAPGCDGRLLRFAGCLNGDPLTMLDELLTASQVADSRLVRALTGVLAVRRPEAIPGLLDRLVPGLEVDELRRSLVRNAWISAAQAREIVDGIVEPRVRLRAELDLHLNGLAGPAPDGREAGLAALAELAESVAIDSCDPREASLIRLLWSLDPMRACRRLAVATRNCLANGDADHALDILCLWLHAYLDPESDGSREERRRRGEDLLESLRAVGSLPAPPTHNARAGVSRAGE